MPSKVTIATVARHANVSRQTVSNVLNAPDMVRDETRARVIAAIEKLGYRANLAARQMRTGRSRLIGVRIDPVRNGIEAAVLDRFLHGLTEAAAPAGYRIVLYTATDDDAEIATYEELLATYAPDGFVLTQTHYHDARTRWLLAHDIPFTTFGRPWGAPERHSWVDVDGAAGTAAATAHLIGAGHRRIAFLGWPPGSGVGDDRRSGWATTMAANGLDTGGLARRALDGIAEGERMARELLAEPDPPTAVVCASDPLAIGAWRAGDSRAGELRAGESRTGESRAGDLPAAGGLAAIGFDDTPMAQAAGLSSVRQPLVQVAAECIRTLSLVLGDRPGAPAAALIPSPTDGGNHHNTTYDAGGDPAAGDPAGRRVLLRPDLVVRDSG